MTSIAPSGSRMHAFARELYPICRSITGDGLRQTLRAVQARIPIRLEEVPSGTQVLDWVVPDEWNIRGGRIETLGGEVIVDFAQSNLHVLGYSAPIDAIVTREDLARHVYTDPRRPDVVPYRTSYYSRNWGFCLPQRLWDQMTEASYRVVIDSDLHRGHLTYGELLIPGEEPDEVLVSVHCCHPSLANDNLSGIVVAAELAEILMARRHRLGFRFLFVPATIGAVTWLARNESAIGNIAHGLVLTCVGDRGSFHYKRSRRENAAIDRSVAYLLEAKGLTHEILPFSPIGYDERQYGSPGFNLPVGCLMRSPNGTFPEYHSSADNLDFIAAEALQASCEFLVDLMSLLDRNIVFSRVDGRGEPQLGRRGLYAVIGGSSAPEAQTAMLWLLNMADGGHSILDIAARSGVPFDRLAAAVELAEGAGLIQRVSRRKDDG